MTMQPKFRCFACGRFTDEVTEGGPSPDDDDVGQVRRWETGVLDVHVKGKGCCAAVACWNCFWATQPDMWILAEHWDALKPQVSSERLPQMLDVDTVDFKHEDPASYPWPLEANANTY